MWDTEGKTAGRGHDRGRTSVSMSFMEEKTGQGRQTLTERWSDRQKQSQGKGRLQRQGKGTERSKEEAGGEDETEKDGEMRKTGRDRLQETRGEQEGEMPGERARKGKRGSGPWEVCFF